MEVEVPDTTVSTVSTVLEEVDKRSEIPLEENDKQQEEDIDAIEQLKYEFYEWKDKPFTLDPDGLCTEDPYFEIKDLRYKLNMAIFLLEKSYPFLCVRNLRDVDQYFVNKKSYLELPKQSLTENQRILLNDSVLFIDEPVKRIGNYMRQLHSLLMAGGFIAKKLRNKRKNSKSKSSTLDMLNAPVPPWVNPPYLSQMLSSILRISDMEVDDKETEEAEEEEEEEEGKEEEEDIAEAGGESNYYGNTYVLEKYGKPQY